MDASTIAQPIGPPPWQNVRKIYKRLSDEFNVLLEPYGIVLSDIQKLRLDHLIIAIDRIDHYIDHVDDKKNRDATVQFIMQSLNENATPQKEPIESFNVPIQSNVEILAKIVEAQGIKHIFNTAAEAVFYHTEAKRFVTKRTLLLQHVMQEGLATAQLPLSFMQLESTHPFVSFFSDLCVLMGIADLFVDLRKDYKVNLIVVQPTFLFRLQLLWMVLFRGMKLFLKFPRKWSLLLYCLRFGWILIREQD